MTNETTTNGDRMDRWRDRLSDYLDGELSAADAQELERHLARCEACAGRLEELRAVVARAGALEPAEPPRDLWPGIAARIGGRSESELEVGAPISLSEVRRRRERRTSRRFTLSLPQLAAAAVALMVFSGGVVWLATSNGAGRPAAGIAGLSEPSPGASFLASVDRPQSSTLARYQAAIAELEHAIFYGGEQLDTTTVRRIRTSLETIDRAITEAWRALEADPSNPYVNRHLAETMRRKVEFLQHTAVLAVARG